MFLSLSVFYIQYSVHIIIIIYLKISLPRNLQEMIESKLKIFKILFLPLPFPSLNFPFEKKRIYLCRCNIGVLHGAGGLWRAACSRRMIVCFFCLFFSSFSSFININIYIIMYMYMVINVCGDVIFHRRRRCCCSLFFLISTSVLFSQFTGMKQKILLFY